MKFPIQNFKFPPAGASAGGGRCFRFPLSAFRFCRAFSLIEIMVVVALLSLIVVALMAVFSSTQRAFRSGVTQTDVMEGGRAAMDLMATDLHGVAPSGGVTNGPVNFAVLANSHAYYPLVQPLPGSAVLRTNLLNYFFVLSRQHTKWIGVGYVVDNTNGSTLYPLYRFYAETNLAAGPLSLFNSFSAAVAASQWNSMSHLIDCVVHLNLHAYDTAGGWINNATAPYTNAVNTRFFSVVYGEPQIYMFSNTVPAAVELEVGVLEDRARSRAESLPDNAPAAPPNDRRTLFLQSQAGAVHIFRTRVTVPNVDRTAYQ